MRVNTASGDLFDEWLLLKYRIQSIASIVQNPGIEVTKDEVDNWNKAVDSLITDIRRIQRKTLDIIK